MGKVEKNKEKRDLTLSLSLKKTFPFFLCSELAPKHSVIFSWLYSRGFEQLNDLHKGRGLKQFCRILKCLILQKLRAMLQDFGAVLWDLEVILQDS